MNQLGFTEQEWENQKKKNSNRSSIYLPALIEELHGLNVTQIQSTAHFGLALCQSDDEQLSTIISHWCRLFTCPDDIKSLIFLFSKFQKVYTTAYYGHGLGDEYEKNVKYGWAEIEDLNDKNIIKFSIGNAFSLFLAANGAVYACGDNMDGQLGLGEDAVENTNVPLEIEYFTDLENGIKIVDIACCSDAALALDVNGRVYAWGYNHQGQCAIGDNIPRRIYTPRLIDALIDYDIDLIRCGYNHCTARSKCGNHWIWGQNDDNECLTYEQDEYDRFDNVHSTKRIDKIIKETCEVGSVVEVHPGYYSTKIICK